MQQVLTWCSITSCLRIY